MSASPASPVTALAPRPRTPRTAARRAGLAVLLAAATAATGFAAARHAAAGYAVDPSHTSVVFAVTHLGYSYTYGMFRETSGTCAVDLRDPAASSFDLRVKTASLDTNDAKRDEHLRGGDFFSARQFPEIRFVSTAVAAEGRTWNVTGDLTLHGRTRPVTLPLTMMGAGRGPYGKQRVGFAGKVVLDRADFGMNTMPEVVGRKVTVLISFEGILAE